MKTIITLLKREYWENRSGFLVTPLAIGGFLVFLLTLALFNTENVFGSGYISVNGKAVNAVSISGFDLVGGMNKEFVNLPLEERQAVWEKIFYGVSKLFTYVMVFVSFIYLLGALYDDRKDRSILFWKSLPVSDLMTVISKVLTVLLVIPAFYSVILAMTYFVMLLIISLVGYFSGGSIYETIWQPAPFIMAPIKLYMSSIIHTAWAAPFIGWLLLVSSWTRWKPVMVATIPLAMVALLELYYYRTGHFAGAIWERVFGWFAPPDKLSGLHFSGYELMYRENVSFQSSHQLLWDSGFWYGLLLASFMVAAAIYIRRYRDESL